MNKSLVTVMLGEASISVRELYLIYMLFSQVSDKKEYYYTRHLPTLFGVSKCGRLMRA